MKVMDDHGLEGKSISQIGDLVVNKFKSHVAQIEEIIEDTKESTASPETKRRRTLMCKGMITSLEGHCLCKFTVSHA
jgi:hypothetical protein